jgi:hypothetical protein
MRGLAQVSVPSSSSILTSIAVNGTELLAVGETTNIQSPGYELSNGDPDFPFTGKLTLSTFDITLPDAPTLQGT